MSVKSQVISLLQSMKFSKQRNTHEAEQKRKINKKFKKQNKKIQTKKRKRTQTKKPRKFQRQSSLEVLIYDRIDKL